MANRRTAVKIYIQLVMILYHLLYHKELILVGHLPRWSLLVTPRSISGVLTSLITSKVNCIHASVPSKVCLEDIFYYQHYLGRSLNRFSFSSQGIPKSRNKCRGDIFQKIILLPKFLFHLRDLGHMSWNGGLEKGNHAAITRYSPGINGRTRNKI